MYFVINLYFSRILARHQVKIKFKQLENIAQYVTMNIIHLFYCNVVIFSVKVVFPYGLIVNKLAHCVEPKSLMIHRGAMVQHRILCNYFNPTVMEILVGRFVRKDCNYSVLYFLFR